MRLASGIRLGTDRIPWYNCVDPIPYDLGDTADMVLDRIAARLRKRVAQDGPAH
ncbi:MAG: hypothetical protein HN793_02120 [Rhodospirillaceae bacterium]|nr:hypothetical protein [Rhodospirillaceae bacterium]MBT5242013.1 hypothetical protein [Rhodospirillaceae bacterium]MBT5565738.1 hypothetical protein [Rhodospirillaceae bacterium]MBT6088535.1 hypothetical protein [Rhodospirillaceae bacterium]MBT6960542.1 hypothetical protein [Rhodospirillaceae bacterium]